MEAYNFWVVHEPFLHDLRRTELTPANEDVYVRAVFCQVCFILGTGSKWNRLVTYR